MRSNNVRLAPEAEPNAETWSVSKTSNLVFVGLLLPILAPQAFRFPRHFIIGQAAGGAAPILVGRSQIKHLLTQRSDLLFQILNAFLYRLRHYARLTDRFHDFHNYVRWLARSLATPVRTSAIVKRKANGEGRVANYAPASKLTSLSGQDGDSEWSKRELRYLLLTD